MSNKLISDLPATSAVAGSTLLETLFDPSGTPASEKLTLDVLRVWMSSQISYGSCYVYSEDVADVTISAELADTYYPVIGFTNCHVAGAPFLTLADTVFTVGVSGAGVYRTGVMVSLEADKGSILHMNIVKNGLVTENISSDLKIANANDQRAMGMAGLLTLAAGDTVSMRIKSSASSTLIGFRHGSFTLERISAA